MANALDYRLLAQVRLVRNGLTMYEQTFNTIPRSYTESTHQAVVLGTNMAVPEEVDLAGVTSAPGVSTAHTVFLQTDRAIGVAVNDPAHLWPLNANGAMMLTGTVSHLYVYNESTTNQATVELVVLG
jgi:hypothetical protein